MKKLIASIALSVMTATASAAPLSLDYSITDLGGAYQYDFTLTLDNNDNTWSAGQGWDWIIFGDANYDGTITGFDPDGSGGIGSDFSFISLDSPWTSTTSAGGHNGPTIGYLDGVAGTYWSPVLGESVSWSGSSSIYLGEGDLYWSALLANGGSSSINYEVANLSPVPVPAAAWLFGSALLGLIGLRRKYLKKAA